MPLLRLFLAAETPSDIRSAIAAARDELKRSNADVRWESTEKLHITLRFLGDTDPELLRVFVPIVEGVADDRGPIGVLYGGVGCFPHPKDPRVIWVGVQDPSGKLAELQQQIEEACRRIGCRPEPKKFHAHVTIGRVKGTRNLTRLLEMMESATLQGLAATIGSIQLMKSVLQPGGSVYSTMHTFELAR